jgi:hypothetical protein
MKSAFLTLLVKKQKVRFDPRKGWTGPSGCRLAFGRPLVCYDFFCDAISKNGPFQAADITEFIHEFVSIGNRAHGATHLICIDNLECVSRKKIKKMKKKIDSLLKRSEVF